MKPTAVLTLAVLVLGGCIRTQQLQLQPGPGPGEMEGLSDTAIRTINSVAEGRRGTICLTDGSRLKARQIHVSRAEVLWQDAEGRQHRASVSNVREIWIHTGRGGVVLKHALLSGAFGALFGAATCPSAQDELVLAPTCGTIVTALAVTAGFGGAVTSGLIESSRSQVFVLSPSAPAPAPDTSREPAIQPEPAEPAARLGEPEGERRERP
jgi:hypothetical protein